MALWQVIHYRCSKCKAEDSDKLLVSISPLVPYLNCWKCHGESTMQVCGKNEPYESCGSLAEEQPESASAS